MCIKEEMGKNKTTEAYEGYFYSVSDAIKIMIIGLLCSQKTMKEIHEWATSKSVSKMLKEHFGIGRIPCYSQFTNIVGLIDSEELNKTFMEFFHKIVESVIGKTIAFDEKRYVQR